MYKKLLSTLLLLSTVLNAETGEGCPSGEYFQQGTTICILGEIVIPPGIWLPNCEAGDRLLQGQGDGSCTETTPVDPPGLFLPSCQYGYRLDQGTETCVDMHLSTLKKTGQTTIYAAYDDGYYKVGVTPSYTRDDTKEVVTDHVTGLMWQDDAAVTTVTKTWPDAEAYCRDDVSTGGYNDWRWPTIVELQAIVVDAAYNPSIDTTAFVNYTSDYYWSSTTFAANTSSAWIVSFYDGYTRRNGKTYTYHVRCVRAGQ